MNPLTFYGSKFDKEPQELIDEVYKIILSMELSTSERPSWPLINSITCLKHGLCNGEIIGRCEVILFTWEIFKKTFLNRFFPREMREAKVVEFINLYQGGMSVHE